MDLSPSSNLFPETGITRAPYVPGPQFSETGLPLPVKKPSLDEDFDYYRIAKPVQCVPYARERSGIQIRGNAHTWWHQAAYRPEYQQGSRPKEGAVLVLSRAGKLKYGHVAVVQRVIDSRNIEVAHSNWGYNRTTRSYIYNRMPVKDVSANNDWSKVRFWDYPSRSYGRAFPVSGFIYR